MFVKARNTSSIDDAILAMHHTRRSTVVDLDLLWNKVREDEEELKRNIETILNEIGTISADARLLEAIKLYLKTLPMDIKEIGVPKPGGGSARIKILEEHLTGEVITDAVRRFLNVKRTTYSKLVDKIGEISRSLNGIVLADTLIKAFAIIFDRKCHRAIPVQDYKVTIKEDNRTRGVKLDLALVEGGELRLAVHVARAKYQYSGSTRRRYTYTKPRTKRVLKAVAYQGAKVLILTDSDEIINRLYADIANVGLVRGAYKIVNVSKLRHEDKLWIGLAGIIAEVEEPEFINIWINGFENILKNAEIYNFIKDFIGEATEAM